MLRKARAYALEGEVESRLRGEPAISATLGGYACQGIEFGCRRGLPIISWRAVSLVVSEAPHSWSNEGRPRRCQN